MPHTSGVPKTQDGCQKEFHSQLFCFWHPCTGTQVYYYLTGYVNGWQKSLGLAEVKLDYTRQRTHDSGQRATIHFGLFLTTKKNPHVNPSFNCCYCGSTNLSFSD